MEPLKLHKIIRNNPLWGGGGGTLVEEFYGIDSEIWCSADAAVEPFKIKGKSGFVFELKIGKKVQQNEIWKKSFWHIFSTF